MRSGWLVVIAVVLVAGCSGADDPMGDDPITIEDPAAVKLTGRPNQFLLCPDGVCRATPDQTSPVFRQPVDQVVAAWLAVISAQPRVVTLAAAPERQLYLLEQRSAVFGFPDRISVRFLATDDGGATLVMLSSSVYGYWDGGANRRRVLDWVEQLEAALQATPG